MIPHARRITRELLFDSSGFGVVSGLIPCVRRIDPRPALRAPDGLFGEAASRQIRSPSLDRVEPVAQGRVDASVFDPWPALRAGDPICGAGSGDRPDKQFNEPRQQKKHNHGDGQGDPSPPAGRDEVVGNVHGKGRENKPPIVERGPGAL